MNGDNKNDTALLGDCQDIQQPGDGDPRAALDEMDRPVMRPAIAASRQHRVRVAGGVAIGEEQQFHQIEKCWIGLWPVARGDVHGARNRGRSRAGAPYLLIYVSHVDLLWADCY